MKPLMRFHIFDQALNSVGQFNAYTYAEWREDYKETGKLYIECVDTEYNTKTVQQGYYIYRPDIKKAMVVRQIEFEPYKQLMKIRGFLTSDLLSQRVINPTATNHTMDVNNVEQGVYDIINTNKRSLDSLITAPVKGYADSHDTQYTGTNALNASISLIDESELGFTTTLDIDKKQHIFEVYQGLDRTYGNGVNSAIVFSDNPQNILNLTILNDNGDFKNFAYVAGEGEGTARVVVEVPNATNEPGAVIPQGIGRFETWLDARNVQRNSMALARYRQVLYAKGKEELAQRLNVLSFKGDPVTEGSYVFREDYNLGDMVTCDSKKYGMRFDARVESYTEISQYNATILKIQLGNSKLARVREAT